MRFAGKIRNHLEGDQRLGSIADNAWARLPTTGVQYSPVIDTKNDRKHRRPRRGPGGHSIVPSGVCRGMSR